MAANPGPSTMAEPEKEPEKTPKALHPFFKGGVKPPKKPVFTPEEKKQKKRVADAKTKPVYWDPSY